MVFDQLNKPADHRDSEAKEKGKREANLFEVRVLDRVNRCFESTSFLFSHVPVCAEEDAHLWLASSAQVPRTWSVLDRV